MCVDPTNCDGGCSECVNDRDKKRLVTVCDKCLRACCWHGEFMCDQARGAGITTRTVAELDAMSKEHPSCYSLDRIRKICGDLGE